MDSSPTESGKPRVMVTGGAGFIGSYVTRELWQEGFEVCVIDVAEPGPEARFVLGDAYNDIRLVIEGVENAAAVLEVARTFAPSAFVHLAAVVDPVALKTDPLLASRVNLGGTINILEAAREVDAKTVVYCSSVGVLPTIQYEPIDASHPLILPTQGPGSGFYGASKVASEAFCFAYEQGFGLDIRIIRPSAVYGFGMQWPIYIKPMVEGAVRGEEVAFETGGSFPRDYTHAADIASLTVRLLDAPDSADRVFFGATGQPLVTAAEVAEVVRTLIPEANITIGAEFGPRDHIELKYRGVISVENARTQLGWSPRFSNIRDGVEDYVNRYREYLNTQT